METPVGALSFAFTGEHSCAQLVLPLEGEDARSVWESARQILPGQVAVEVAVVLRTRQGHLRDGAVGQGFGRGRDGERLAANVVGVFAAAVGLGRDAEFVEGRGAVLERFIGHQFLDLGFEVVRGRRRVASPGLLGRSAKVLDQAQAFGHVLFRSMVITDAGRDFGEVMHALRRNDAGASAGFVSRF